MPVNICQRCKKEKASLRPCNICEQDYCTDCWHIHAPNCDAKPAIDDVDEGIPCAGHPAASIMCHECGKHFCNACYNAHTCEP